MNNITFFDDMKKIDLTVKSTKQQQETFTGTLAPISLSEVDISLDSVNDKVESTKDKVANLNLFDLIKSIDLSTLKVTEDKGKFHISHKAESSSFHLSVSSRDAKVEGNKELVISGNMTLELTSQQVDECTEELKKYFAALNTEE